MFYGISLRRGSDDFFHSCIDQMIDLTHPIAVLASNHEPLGGQVLVDRIKDARSQLMFFEHAAKRNSNSVVT